MYKRRQLTNLTLSSLAFIQYVSDSPAFIFVNFIDVLTPATHKLNMKPFGL